MLILSASSNESPQVRREVQRAFEHNITVIPLRVDNVAPGRALEYYIGPVHWLDALTPPLEAHLERLADTVRRLIATSPDVPPFSARRPLPQMPPVEGGEPVDAGPPPEAAPRPAPVQTTRPGRLTGKTAAVTAGIVLFLAAIGLATLSGKHAETPPAASPPSTPVRAAAPANPYRGILDGDWSVAFARPDGSRYSGQLTMAGETGTMTLTEYPRRGRARKVVQAMQIVPLDKGFVVRGSSPADFASGNALTNYAADALVFTPAGEKSFRVARCDDRVVDTREFSDCPLVTLRDAGSRS